MLNVVIIDYGSGNLRSAQKAFERSASFIKQKVTVSVSRKAEDLKKASHIVLPGVGAFSDCLDGLESIPEMIEALRFQVLAVGKPFLGICVGMQLLGDKSWENGVTRGLGWIAGDVIKLENLEKSLKVPHMGWNNILIRKKNHPLMRGLNSGDHAYFVHSFHFENLEQKNCYATVHYGRKISAIVGRDNIIGTQFHPEKSQAFGLCLIQNFMEWKP